MSVKRPRLAGLSVTALSVNLNAIAYLRNRRNLPWPDVCQAVRLALEAGAHGVTVHPRPDARHIRLEDVANIKSLLNTTFQDAEFNIEGFPDQAFLEIIRDASPNQVTLVPDDPSQPTSDHGCNKP